MGSRADVPAGTGAPAAPAPDAGLVRPKPGKVVELAGRGHHAEDAGAQAQRRRRAPLVALSFGALGVVFGDIGTSPLYALNELLYGTGALTTAREDVLGAVSLVVWTLTIVVTLKYVVLVLRADYEGEGGVFALLALIRRFHTRYVLLVGTLLVLGAGLLFGDGMITPAISVVSAVEGLQVVAPALHRLVVPLALVILVGLFALQRRGTTGVGNAFGPVMLLWFGALAVLGVREIAGNPSILQALNPVWAVRGVTSLTLHQAALVVSAAILVVTGGEALFADLGHYGARPIRMAWSVVVYPALLLDYLGQGAFVLAGHQRTGGNLFFSSVPRWSLVPMVLLATAAAVVASQALISGAFSLATQGMSLNLVPRMRVVHTHHEHEGQVYVPAVNWALLAGCVLLVLAFRSSARLGMVYGVAVTGVMAFTTLAVMAVAVHRWEWPKWRALLVFAPFAAFDLVLLLAATVKVPWGGWVPLVIGAALASVMFTWRWGRRQVRSAILRAPTRPMRSLLLAKRRAPQHFPKSAILLSTQHVRRLEDPVPPILELFYQRYEVLPKHLILLTIRLVKRPYVRGKDRYEIEVFENDPDRDASLLSVEASFGFMEDPDVEAVIADLAADDRLTPGDDLSGWIIRAAKERVVIGPSRRRGHRLRYGLFKVLSRTAEPMYAYLGLGDDARLDVEYFPVVL